jgi:hypothetical protein
MCKKIFIFYGKIFVQEMYPKWWAKIKMISFKKQSSWKRFGITSIWSPPVIFMFLVEA